MVIINFLPWRDEVRKRRQIVFGAMCVVSVIPALLILLGMHYLLIYKIAEHEERISFMTNNIKALGAKILRVQGAKDARNQLVAQMNVLQSLQEARFMAVRILDELTKIIPPKTYITQLMYKDEIIDMVGFIDSGSRVSILMNNINHSQWFKDPILKVINKDGFQQDVGKRTIFEIQMKPKYRISERNGY